MTRLLCAIIFVGISTYYYEVNAQSVRCDSLPSLMLANSGCTSDGSPEIILDACKVGHGSVEECEWQKQCMAADHPGWGGRDKKAMAKACAVDYKEFGRTVLEYPNFHYDSKSWQNLAPSGDAREANAELVAKAACRVRSPETLARGMYGCVDYSVEWRRWDEQAKQQWYGLKLLGARIKNKFANELTPENPLPPRYRNLP